MSTQPRHFVIMAGGTGGHVFPGLAVASQLQSMGHTVSWLGTRAGIEKDLVPRAGIAIDYIQINGVRGKGIVGLLLAPFRIFMAVVQSLRVFARVRPDCVLGMGGFVAGPGGFAAKLFRVPLVIHEQNAIPGTTNKILARMANKVLAAFPQAFAKNIAVDVVGNPVRPGFVAVEKNTQDSVLHLLVVGGSLGARAINEIMPEFIDALGFTVELHHQTGKTHFEQMQAIYESKYPNVTVMPFIDDMAAEFQWADIAICRAGAMTVSEMAAAGLPAIFVPFPYAIDDHQTANAQWMVTAGAAILLPQDILSVERLVNIITDLNIDREKLKTMRNKAAALGIHDATLRVADCCVELAR